MRKLILPIYIVVALVMQGLFTSCDKETEDAPAIERIRYTDPEFADDNLTEVGLGDVIAIIGKGLESTYQVTLNDMSLSLNPVYISNNSILVTIPDDVPTVATHVTVSNKLIIRAESGTIETDLLVLPPAPLISTISNEFAKAGETLTITGKYFYFVENVTFPGGIETSTNLNVNDDATILTVTVPEGITEAGSIDVVTASGTSSAWPMYRFNDVEGMICNFDDKNPFGPWGPKPILETENALEGNYVKVYQENVTAPDWWNNDRVIPINDYPALGISGQAAEYGFKFEVFVPESTPLNSGRIRIQLNWGPYYFWKPWEVNQDMTKYWDFTGDRVPFFTEGWQTIVIPMDLFRSEVDGMPSGDPLSSVDEIDGKFLHFILQNGEAPEGEEITVLDYRIDNIRIVKIK